MKTYKQTELPLVPEREFYVFGYLFRLHDGGINGILTQKKGKLKGVSGVFRNIEKEQNYFCKYSHEEYIEHFKIFLYSLQKTDNESFFSESDVSRIVKMEKIRDKKVGEKKQIYLRVLKHAWLLKTGAYIYDSSFVSFSKKDLKNKKQAKFCFLIHSIFQKEDSGLEILRKKDKGKIFPMKPKSVIPLSYKNINTVGTRLYKGFESIYVKFFRESFEQFRKSLSEKDLKNIEENNNFATELLD